jgi:hypothetical protein
MTMPATVSASPSRRACPETSMPLAAQMMPRKQLTSQAWHSII